MDKKLPAETELTDADFMSSDELTDADFLESDPTSKKGQTPLSGIPYDQPASTLERLVGVAKGFPGNLQRRVAESLPEEEIAPLKEMNSADNNAKALGMGLTPMPAMGLAGRTAVNAAQGAMSSPDKPLQGAAIGAGVGLGLEALTSLPSAGKAAYRAFNPLAKDKADDALEALLLGKKVSIKPSEYLGVDDEVDHLIKSQEGYYPQGSYTPAKSMEIPAPILNKAKQGLDSKIQNSVSSSAGDPYLRAAAQAKNQPMKVVADKARGELHGLDQETSRW